MAHYDDVILPATVRFGSATVPLTSTQQVFTGSGARKVNRLWSQKLRRLRLAYVDEVAGIYDLLNTWEAVEGPAHSFLARDWHDWNTTAGAMRPGDEAKVAAFDQPLMNTGDGSFAGDGATTVFQCVKRYAAGATAAHTRVIAKPEALILVAVDGAVQSAGADYTLDPATGRVAFASPPGAGVSPSGVAVTWGGAFRLPVAFADDDSFVEELRSGATSGLSVELLEVRP